MIKVDMHGHEIETGRGGVQLWKGPSLSLGGGGFDGFDHEQLGGLTDARSARVDDLSPDPDGVVVLRDPRCPHLLPPLLPAGFLGRLLGRR